MPKSHKVFVAGSAIVGAIVVFAVGCLAIMSSRMGFQFIDPGRGVCNTSDVAIVRAAGVGNTNEVRSLLDQGASTNTADRDSNTALGCAVPRGHDEVVALLLARGADPNGDSGDGEFMEVPLGLAIRHQQYRGIELLLNAGADPDRVDCKGTPLDTAATLSDVNVVETLLANGADPNGSQHRRPPLVEAARARSLSVATALLDHGADPNGRDGALPAIRAASNGDNALLDLLLARGASLDVETGGSSGGS